FSGIFQFRIFCWSLVISSGALGRGQGAWGMGHGAWGIGYGAWGIGHLAWGMGHGAWGMGHWSFGISHLAFGIWHTHTYSPCLLGLPHLAKPFLKITRIVKGVYLKSKI
ncbi:hypothetical protein KBT16_08310, partial [Nostoc sp. CCCryo 231-06]|nr:hypothetical protein [Nostoc sp. CCCryo 231-06]